MQCRFRGRTAALCFSLTLLCGEAVRSADITPAPASTGLKPPERLPQPKLLNASDEPSKAMAKFRIAPGFKVDLWAAEPMLANPVAFCLDEKGILYTAETYRYRTSALDIRHYMFMLEDDLASRSTDERVAYIKKNFPNDWQNLAIETEVVRRLEDSDADGKADKSTVFVDDMRTLLDGINSGVLAFEGKVWCTNIPNLWLFSGLTPDGRAAQREALSSGYGVRFSFTGHDLHGLIIGPDGRLYFSFGDRGAHVTTKEGKTLAFPDEGAVVRCELDGSRLEMVHRGLRNPQELAFDDHGNLFTGDNDSDQGDRERWVYVVEGGDSGWRVGWQHNPLGKDYNPWLAEQMWEPRASDKNQPAYILSPILNIPDGPSGIVHYPGTGLPAEFADHFFVCGFKGTSARSAITHLKVREQGAGFAVEKAPAQFVGDVQATDIDFGPDSRIYFSEWGEGWEGTGRGRIFRMEHTPSQQ
jgi:quinoprotein glucose dehydrogenase